MIFSSALNDLTSAFGVADLDKPSGVDDGSSKKELTSSTSKGQKVSGSLTAKEEKIYLEINKQYSKIMKGKDFYSALDDWKKKLPKLLKKYKISEKEWNIISEKGDTDEKLADLLAEITKK